MFSADAPAAAPKRLPLAAITAATLRAHHAAPPEPCRTCPLFPVCRGGCQVVSRHETGGFAPDPECPRVLAAAGAEAGCER
jgi:hypothetical protein